MTNFDFNPTPADYSNLGWVCLAKALTKALNADNNPFLWAIASPPEGLFPDAFITIAATNGSGQAISFRYGSERKQIICEGCVIARSIPATFRLAETRITIKEKLSSQQQDLTQEEREDLVSELITEAGKDRVQRMMNEIAEQVVSQFLAPYLAEFNQVQLSSAYALDAKAISQLELKKELQRIVTDILFPYLTPENETLSYAVLGDVTKRVIEILKYINEQEKGATL